ncbi:MAG: FAD-binding protein [Pirellulaceae bacterium]
MNYDVIIVGGGIAGCYAALSFDPTVKILILTKENFDGSLWSERGGGIGHGKIYLQLQRHWEERHDGQNAVRLHPARRILT